MGDRKRAGSSQHPSLRGKAAQVALAVCCFILPIFCLPLAWRESGTDLWVHAGLRRTSIRRVVACRAAGPLIYALAADRGVYRSTDDGTTWTPADSGLPRDSWGRVQAQVLAVVDGSPAVAYAGLGPVQRQEAALGTGLYFTDDAGTTWLAVGKDMAGSEVQAIAGRLTAVPLEPTGEPQVDDLESSPGAASVVYVATSRGIMRSIDLGRSWSRLDWRGVEVQISVLAIDPSDPAVVYVGTQGGGLYSTRDAGATWSEMNEGLGDLDINDIKIAESDARLMYVATNGGVYRSANAGSTWVRLEGTARNQSATELTLDPHDANVVCVGLEHGAVSCSLDGGTHWTSLRRGLGEVTVFSLALDARRSGVVWAGTADGVWRYVPESNARSPEPGATLLQTPSIPLQTQSPSVTAAQTRRETATSSPSPSPGHVSEATVAPTATATTVVLMTRALQPSATRTEPAPSSTPTGATAVATTPATSEPSPRIPTAAPPAPTATPAPR
jgi:photosystem II stability/assembly factor-like uncharacterized protein